MHNLPWLRGRVYPLQILPTREMLKGIAAESGKLWVIENVMGARWGAKGLAKRGLQAHGMQAGFLCGTMFGLPFYRHRLFETNWLWLAPEHPQHRHRIRPVESQAGRARDIVFPKRGGTLPHSYADGNRVMALTKWQNGAQAEGVGVGHAKGWRLAAEALGIDWMDRDELTQAIPPVYTGYIVRQMLKVLAPKL